MTLSIHHRNSNARSVSKPTSSSNVVNLQMDHFNPWPTPRSSILERSLAHISMHLHSNPSISLPTTSQPLLIYAIQHPASHPHSAYAFQTLLILINIQMDSTSHLQSNPTIVKTQRSPVIEPTSMPSSPNPTPQTQIQPLFGLFSSTQSNTTLPPLVPHRPQTTNHNPNSLPVALDDQRRILTQLRHPKRTLD